MTYYYKKACVCYRLALSPETFEWLGTWSTCRYRHIWCILATGAYFLQLYTMCLPWSIASMSTSMDAPLVSQWSPGVPHTSLPVPLLQDCQHLSVGALVHLVRFRAGIHHMWLLPYINIFCASQLLVSLGGHQLEPHSPECKHKFASVVTQVFKCGHGNEGREQCTFIPMGLLMNCDVCAQLAWCVCCLQLQNKDILG